MPQVLKDEVRARIEAAALQVFAERGYAGAKMTAIAERAGVGTASTYRYYAGKRELFDALVTPALAEGFESLLDRRARALSRAFRAEATRGADDIGDELLRFWAKHRLAVVILLDRTEGTDYAAFGARFVELEACFLTGFDGGRSAPERERARAPRVARLAGEACAAERPTDRRRPGG